MILGNSEHLLGNRSRGVMATTKSREKMEGKTFCFFACRGEVSRAGELGTLT
jgi:hypothetical protein